MTKRQRTGAGTVEIAATRAGGGPSGSGGRLIAERTPAAGPTGRAEPARVETSPPKAAPKRPVSTPQRPGRRTLLLLSGALAIAGIFVALRYLVPRPAEVLPVHPGAFRAEITGPGTLDAIDKASVSSSLQGVITALPVERNDVVSRGEVLAAVNAADLRAQLRAAIASQEAAARAVEAAHAETRRADATLANARQTLVRQRELARTGAASQSALDTAETAVRQGEADLAKARSSVDQAEAQHAAAAATVEVNRAQLDKSVIRAPITGVVIARSLNLGDIVSPGTPILELVDPLSVVLTTRFDESEIASVSVGQPATIRFLSQPGPIDATVRRISREVDTETREFTVDLAPVRLPVNWAIGQRGTASIGIGEKTDVLSIPSAAIAWREGVPGIWRVERGRAVWRPCVLGEIGGQGVEIVSGLGAGEVVITDPAQVYRFMRIRATEQGA